MNYELRLYDHLLQFALFQGMSQGELLQLAGNTRLGFQKASAGHRIVRDGDPCRLLYFLIKGQVTVETSSDDYSYRLTEWLSAPWLVQPEALFGMTTRHTQTVVAQTEAHFITIDKDEMLRLLDDFLIIRLNMLNIMATLAQRRTRLSWHRSPQQLQGRIARFITDHCTYPAGPKVIAIRMERLAHEMNDSRLDVSRALNAMQSDGLLRLHRGRIEVPSLERLFM